ncbi:MAG: hypothetical protein M3Y27_21905, partial [Acidobacteriota bacterium]|nr:hypothetical protein [Acidobacteriota bacterium]
KMPAEQRRKIADRARKRALRFHSAAARAGEFEAYVLASLEKASCPDKRSRAALQHAPSAALI